MAKIGHSLGKLRDLDVLLEVLSRTYQSQLPAKKQKILDRVIKSLEKQRRREIEQARKTLNSKLYLNLKQGLNSWLEQPKYQTSGDLAISYALPDLLLPQVSEFLLHSSWFVGVDLKNGEIEIPEHPEHECD